jgi:hypothetical protein
MSSFRNGRFLNDCLFTIMSVSISVHYDGDSLSWLEWYGEHY